MHNIYIYKSVYIFKDVKIKLWRKYTVCPVSYITGVFMPSKIM